MTATTDHYPVIHAGCGKPHKPFTDCPDDRAPLPSTSTEGPAMTDRCRHCARPIRPGDDVAPWVHTDTGNGFCDVTGPADAVEHRRMPPQERYEAEPA